MGGQPEELSLSLSSLRERVLPERKTLTALCMMPLPVHSMNGRASDTISDATASAKVAAALPLPPWPPWPPWLGAAWQWGAVE